MMRLARVRWRRWMPTALAVCVALGFVGVLLLNLAFLERVALADAPGAAGSRAAADRFAQDPAWVARKLAYQVTRPRHPGDDLLPVSCIQPCYQYPTAYTLQTNVVAQTLEPGNDGTDATGRPYHDVNFTRLCGPGAAANALAFWNDDIKHAERVQATDTANGITTTWDGQHNRAYLLRLAWQVTYPGAAHPGMMDTHDPSWGVTLYTMRDALNWEASGHDRASWHEFFYTLAWSSQSSADEFHRRVQDDVANAHVPVVAEVSARLLPNWPSQGDTVFHFVTVVGYDDAAGIYYYTDTCGHSTGCGSKADGGVQTASQAQMWAAIAAVPVNTSPAYNAGDGGYVW